MRLHLTACQFRAQPLINRGITSTNFLLSFVKTIDATTCLLHSISFSLVAVLASLVHIILEIERSLFHFLLYPGIS